MSSPALYQYLLRLGDNSLILGQRLSEWCGHGPVLEEDIALTNIALDLIGQATQILDYAAEVGGEGKTADDIAFLRDAWDFKNVILVELNNGDFAVTMARQFFFSAYQDIMYEALESSADERLKAIAQKSSKELGYHYKHSREWMLRLGDGTEESHQRVQHAINELWEYTGEMFEDDEIEKTLADAGVITLNADLKAEWTQRVESTLKEATLEIPQGEWMHSGGRSGKHSEHLGHILSEMQFLQRAYPGNKW